MLWGCSGVCKIFFALNSPIFRKSCAEKEKDRENRQIQTVSIFKQMPKEVGGDLRVDVLNLQIK